MTLRPPVVLSTNFPVRLRLEIRADGSVVTPPTQVRHAPPAVRATAELTAEPAVARTPDEVEEAWICANLHLCEPDDVEARAWPTERKRLRRQRLGWLNDHIEQQDRAVAAARVGGPRVWVHYPPTRVLR